MQFQVESGRENRAPCNKRDVLRIPCLHLTEVILMAPSKTQCLRRPDLSFLPKKSRSDERATASCRAARGLLIRHARKSLAALGLLVLSACTTTTSETKPAPQLATTEEAVVAFRKTCLASLPDFRNFSALAQKAGLKSVAEEGPLENAHQLPDKRLFVGLAPTPSGKVCNILVDSSEDPRAIGQALLAAARAQTGKGAEKAFPSSFFNFAIHLPNGSLFTHHIRRTRGGKRSLVFLSNPISEDQIPVLIYN